MEDQKTFEHSDGQGCTIVRDCGHGENVQFISISPGINRKPLYNETAYIQVNDIPKLIEHLKDLYAFKLIDIEQQKIAEAKNS